MTDVATYPEAEAKSEVPDTTSMQNNKRKRSSLDQGPTSGRPAPTDATRTSSFQRVSPGSANSTGVNDQSATTFLTGHHSTGTGEDDMHQHTNTDLDFSQLAQHTNDHSLHQNGSGNPTNASDTAAAALSHHFQMTVPQATELSFQNQGAGGEGDRALGNSFSMGDHNMHQASHGMTDYGLDALNKSNSQGGNDSPPSQVNQKPAVGSEEWHKIRRDNHKEVERRRRETINEGINELAKIVPGCEKNKGSILQRAVQFITQLKENESQNIEKWTLEKLLTEQAITELSASCDKFKGECQRAWAEAEIWKKACQNAGIVPDEYQNQGDKADQNGDS
ncbi:basic helix-loop-helix protein [Diplodia seriata]|uniref:Basic helix-loop-helix protein n=2 Tax=Diplodia TaxID=66735 RepID=A0ABR3TQJ4_9PEZI|nr:putative bHLH domain-containing protein [Diplodia seriata]